MNGCTVGASRAIREQFIGCPSVAEALVAGAAHIVVTTCWLPAALQTQKSILAAARSTHDEPGETEQVNDPNTANEPQPIWRQGTAHIHQG